MVFGNITCGETPLYSLVATTSLCLIYANEGEVMVSQNTTAIFGGAFYLG
jgi:hypothetical protein